MRPKTLGQDTIALMQEMRANGASYRQIADKLGVGTMTAYYAVVGVRFVRPQPTAANDNDPSKSTVLMPTNGGCSTTSGLMPVSVVRIPTLEKAEVPLSEMERAA